MQLRCITIEKVYPKCFCEIHHATLYVIVKCSACHTVKGLLSCEVSQVLITMRDVRALT